MFSAEKEPIWPETRPFLALLEQHVGLALGTEKQYLIQSRLQPLAKEHGLGEVPVFLAKLLTMPIGSLHWQCFEAMTTQETRFFRDSFCYDMLREHILPSLIERARNRRAFSIWSAGTSTGQEACSLAILLHDEFPEVRNWNIRIWATDICQQTLMQAQSFTYNSHELNNGLTTSQIELHFSATGDGHWQLSPSLKKWIEVSRHNLIDPSPRSMFDVILLRNVLIYFRADQKQVVLNHMHQSLNHPFGILMLGATEAIFGSSQFLQHKAKRGYYFSRI